MALRAFRRGFQQWDGVFGTTGRALGYLDGVSHCKELQFHKTTSGNRSVVLYWGYCTSSEPVQWVDWIEAINRLTTSQYIFGSSTLTNSLMIASSETLLVMLGISHIITTLAPLSLLSK